MAAGRNGVPTPTGGAVRTAERTGKHPVERTGSARPRQARPNPPGRQGPFDVDDADPRVSSAPGVLDFGALRVPMPPAGQVTVEPSANGRMQAVHVTLPGGRLSVSALAAPKSSKLWPQLAKEIDASLREGGARVRSYKGEWGRELHATTGAASSVFVGVDGPRWMIYGVATGPTGENPDLDAELRRMLRGTVVVRGKSPYPVRTVLPLTTPEELVEHSEQEESAPAPTMVMAARPAAAEPEPPRRRAPVDEPAWADPVQRIADAPDADVLPEDETATAATGLATSSWPVDERTGRPRAPEWTGEQPVPPKRRKAPPVAEVAAAITEPILISAIMGEAPAPTRETPVQDRPTRDRPARDTAARDTAARDTAARDTTARDTAARDTAARDTAARDTTARDTAARIRPTEHDQPVTNRLPVVPTGSDAAPAAGAGPDERAETGIDAYFGWDRTARPELDTERPASRTPVDPLDPSAPVDTRWLDEPGITTAWESVAAGLAADPEPSPPVQGQEPVHEQDWAEWARRELDRAVSGRASPAEVEQAPSSFWDRYGLQEPTTDGRASRRHSSGPEDGERAGQHGRGGRSDEIDPFTARRRSREAVRGNDPDASAQPGRSVDETPDLQSRAGRVHHLHGADVDGSDEAAAGRSARSIWEDMSANPAPGRHGDDFLAAQIRADRSSRAARTDRPGGSDPLDRLDELGWSGGRTGADPVDRSGPATRSDRSGQAARDGWSGGPDPLDPPERAPRSSRSDRSDRDGRSAGTGRAGRSEPGAQVDWSSWSGDVHPLGPDVRAGRSSGSDRSVPDLSGGAESAAGVGRADRSGGSEPDEQAGWSSWSGGADPVDRAARSSGPGRSVREDRSAGAGRAGRSEPGEQVDSSDWSGGVHPLGPVERAPRSSRSDRSAREGRSAGAEPLAEGGRAGRSEPGEQVDWSTWSSGADPLAPGRRTSRSSRSDRSPRDGRSGDAEPLGPDVRAGRSSRSDRSVSGDLFGRGDGAEVADPVDRAGHAGSTGRDTSDDLAVRSRWDDLSRAANAIGRAGWPDRTSSDPTGSDPTGSDPTGARGAEAGRTAGGDWAAGADWAGGGDWTGSSGASTRGDRDARSDPAGWSAAPAGRSGSDPVDDAAPRADAARPASSSSAPRSRATGPDRTQDWLDRITGDTTPGGRRAEGAERTRRAAAEPPRSSPWGPSAAAPDPWAATRGAGAAGWTTGWPGTGTNGRATDDRGGPAFDQPAAEPASGGRRRAEEAGGSTRLSVAELAQRAAREATAPRRSRHTRPGIDRPE